MALECAIRETFEELRITATGVSFERMWPDDELWFPHLFAGRRFEGRCLFDDDALLSAAVENDSTRRVIRRRCRLSRRAARR